MQTFAFIGVTTGQSAMAAIFPRWMAELGAEVQLVGVDLPLHAPPERYREVVARIKHDPHALGGLVTSHKIDLLEAARELFDELDPFAELCGEVSCISKREETLVGHAKDVITSALSLGAIVGDGYWARGGGHVLCLGAGGAGVAITVALLTRPNHGDRPAKIVVTDRSQARLNGLRAIHARLGAPVEVAYVLTQDATDHDALMAELPAGSLVINATGMGKDRLGSPITDAARFPRDGVAWELNYRGELPFLHQARAQQQERVLRVEDGWRYFLYGWTAIVEEVLHLKLTEAQFQRWSAIAAEARR
jgi:shikimate 5-dehydrogenase